MAAKNNSIIVSDIRAGELSYEVVGRAAGMLAACTDLRDVKSIRDKAESVRHYLKAAGYSLDAQNNAAEIRLLAERRAGELLQVMEKRHGARDGKTGSHDVTPLLTDLGVSKMQSSRFQAVSTVPEPVFKSWIAERRENRDEITQSGLLRLAKRQKGSAEADAGSFPEGTYRVLYADPPWKYADDLVESYGAARHHYPTLTLSELCYFADPGGRTVADLGRGDSVLFLWATSPLLPWGLKLAAAWGYEYKASFVWDKVRHNFGHYQSVRHEFLLLCTRGTCLPDSDKLEPSVLRVDRKKHSAKPVEARAMIERMYKGPRVELFAREKSKGWNTWGSDL